jgi:hypothetical protein
MNNANIAIVTVVLLVISFAGALAYLARLRGDALNALRRNPASPLKSTVEALPRLRNFMWGIGILVTVSVTLLVTQFILAGSAMAEKMHFESFSLASHLIGIIMSLIAVGLSALSIEKLIQAARIANSPRTAEEIRIQLRSALESAFQFVYTRLQDLGVTDQSRSELARRILARIHGISVPAEMIDNYGGSPAEPLSVTKLNHEIAFRGQELRNSFGIGLACMVAAVGLGYLVYSNVGNGLTLVAQREARAADAEEAAIEAEINLTKGLLAGRDSAASIDLRESPSGSRPQSQWEFQSAGSSEIEHSNGAMDESGTVLLLLVLELLLGVLLGLAFAEFYALSHDAARDSLLEEYSGELRLGWNNGQPTDTSRTEAAVSPPATDNHSNGHGDMAAAVATGPMPAGPSTRRSRI